METKTVVLIEDDESMAFLIETILTRAGYRVAKAPEGVQGMALIRQIKPALLVLDFMFPAGGGRTFHEGLRNSEAGRLLPVLLLTAVPEAEILGQIKMDGLTYFMNKPLQRAQFLEVVEQILLDVPRAARMMNS